MLHSIRSKLVLSIAMILIGAFALMAVLVMNKTTSILEQQRVQEELTFARSLSQQISAMLQNGDADALYQQALSSARNHNARILVLSPRGTVLIDSQNEYNGRRMGQLEVIDITQGQPHSYGFHLLDAPGQKNIQTLTNRNKERVGYYSVPIRSGANTIGILLLTASIRDVDEQLNAINYPILLTMFGVAAGGILLSLFFASLLTKPINELSIAMQQTTTGDFTARAPAHGQDEIARLARTFNMMSQKLENLDRSRNEFISSASHELRTPLSTIKILIQTLQHSAPDPDMQVEFFSDIDHEIDRLSALIGDLLMLSKIDSGAMQLNLAIVNVDDMLEMTKERLEPLANQREIQIHIEHEPESAFVHADPIKLQQVFYNIMENAIKYTGNGGKVTGRIFVQDDKAHLEIEDTGVGIPEEELEHIFDRFYRVDKARSRNTGGTGLGLSIVRNMVRLHGGEMDVKSEVGVGSVFMVELPLIRHDEGGSHEEIA